VRLASLIRLHVAAFHFANTPDCTAQALAELMKVDIKTVYAWARRPEWRAALNSLHVPSDRTFAREPTRDLIRDTGKLVEEAFEIYKEARLDGHTPKKSVTAVVTALDINRRRINTWAERYEWEAALLKTRNPDGERNFTVELKRS